MGLGNVPNMEFSSTIERVNKEMGHGKEVVQPDMGAIKSLNLETLTQRNAELRIYQTETDILVKVNDLEYDESGYRALTPDEAKSIQEATNMNDATIKDVTINEDGQLKLKCRNEAKADDPNAEVPYKRQVVEVGGYEVEVVMPEFESIFETVLPDELRCASDEQQFKYCTEALQDAIVENPELVDKFTDKQMDQIVNGASRISGYTWHHCPETGRMTLVSTKDHEANRHTGGKAIWGGGRP